MLASSLLAACGSLPPLPEPALDAPVELESTPFFPQTALHCGPASLATMLVTEGINITPEDLANDIYLPGREGTLQVELLAAARLAGLIPVAPGPGPEAMVDTLSSGKPVLVFLNIGSPSNPHWHYAVLVGYDPERQRYTLRSGTTRRAQFSARRFLTAWDWGGRWSRVLLAPGESVDGVTRDAYEAAMVDVSESADSDFVLGAFRGAVNLYPDSGLLWNGYGNAAWKAGEDREALAAFRRLRTLEPASVAALNNIATVYLEAGCSRQAREYTEQARTALKPDDPFRAAVLSTWAEARDAPDNAARCALDP